MGKLVVTLDNVVIMEFELTKERTTLGRRPYNDIVIDNLAVSGEHAILLTVGRDVYLEDLNSTNGTYLNGKAVKKQLLMHNDSIEIGKYKIRYLTEVVSNYEKTMVMRPGSVPPGASPGADPLADLDSSAPLPPPFPAVSSTPASLKVLTGGAAGREVALSKAVTTVGKPGVQVASIARRPTGYMLTHVEGSSRPSLNGTAVGDESMPLRDGDVIELAGTRMQFIQS